MNRGQGDAIGDKYARARAHTHTHTEREREREREREGGASVVVVVRRIRPWIWMGWIWAAQAPSWLAAGSKKKTGFMGYLGLIELCGPGRSLLSLPKTKSTHWPSVPFFFDERTSFYRKQCASVPLPFFLFSSLKRKKKKKKNKEQRKSNPTPHPNPDPPPPPPR
jgi:hypothetical protein